jgi:hypothetical protein
MPVKGKQLLTLGFAWCGAVACAKGDNANVNIARPIVADAVIEVQNRTKDVLSIYVETDHLVDHLGNVPASSTHKFSIPSAIARSADNLYLEARGGAHGVAQRSPNFQLSQGTRVVWTITRNGNGTIALH